MTAELAPELIASGEIHVQIFAMKIITEDDHTLCPTHIEPDYYEVVLRNDALPGDPVIEEWEDLTFDQAQERERLLAEEHPQLSIVWEYA